VSCIGETIEMYESDILEGFRKGERIGDLSLASGFGHSLAFPNDAKSLSTTSHLANV
jgi:hypothetical protein